ncbi:MAG: serine/threonine-protein kinase [Acidobacteriota bacterium]
MDPARESAGSRAFDRLLYEALSVPESEVEAVLEGCPDLRLRARVRRLLKQERELGLFLEQPALERPSLEPPALEPPGGSAPPHRRATRRGGDWLSAWVDTVAANRRRLRRFGGVAGFILLGGALVITLMHGLSETRWDAALLLELGACWGVAAATLALAVAARSPRLADSTVVGLGYGYCVLACGLLAFFHGSHELHRYGLVTPFGPFLVLIALLPLLLHGALRGSLLAAGAAALAAAAGVFASAKIHAAVLGPVFLAEFVTGLGSAVGITLVVKRGMRVLRREIAAGLRLGSYRLIEKLGEGGMGEVWRANHPLLARPAAVKLVRSIHLSAEPSRRDAILRRFNREASTIATLESSHTVQLFDFGVAEDGNVFLAMELLDGIDLQTLVERHGPQPVDRVRASLLQICASLAEAHERNLVHRDVKSANIMLCRRGQEVDHVKVLDFGSVTEADPSKLATLDLTEAGSLLGTPAYLAPEVLSGRDADARSDLYGVGCVAYWLLVGRSVFGHDSALLQMASHLRDVPEPPSALGVELPAELEAILLACLAKDPSARPESAAALARRLEAVPVTGDWSAEQARAWWSMELPSG